MLLGNIKIYNDIFPVFSRKFRKILILYQIVIFINFWSINFIFFYILEFNLVIPCVLVSWQYTEDFSWPHRWKSNGESLDCVIVMEIHFHDQSIDLEKVYSFHSENRVAHHFARNTYFTFKVVTSQRSSYSFSKNFKCSSPWRLCGNANGRSFKLLLDSWGFCSSLLSLIKLELTEMWHQGIVLSNFFQRHALCWVCR